MEHAARPAARSGGANSGNFTNSRAIIDACRPFHWRDRFPAVNRLSPADLAQARAKFGHLLV